MFFKVQNVTFKDICRTHRTSRKRKNKHLPRPIYVKLINQDLKDLVMKRRNVLRSMPQYRGVFIDENLTQLRRWLFGKARLQAGKKNCYTYEGVIFLKVFDNDGSFITKKIAICRDFRDVFDVVSYLLLFFSYCCRYYCILHIYRFFFSYYYNINIVSTSFVRLFVSE